MKKYIRNAVYRVLTLLNIELEPDNDEIVLSNAVFALVGLYACAVLGLPALIFGLSAVYLSAASAWYHYHDRHAYAWGDWSAMYLTFSNLFGLMMFEFSGNPWNIALWLLFGVMLSALHNTMPRMNDIQGSFYVIGLLYALCAAFSFVLMHYGIALLSIAVFAFAYAFQLIAEQKEVPKNVRDKEFYDTFHSFWHYLAALGLFILIYGMQK